jgi:transposase-like protein
LAYQEDCTLPTDLLEKFTEQGLESLPEMIHLRANEAVRIERQSYLSARPYARSLEWRGRANSYKPKKVMTRVGEIIFDVPRVRKGGFYPEALEKGLHSEWALALTLPEIFVQGVSPRKVAAITERL